MAFHPCRYIVLLMNVSLFLWVPLATALFLLLIRNIQLVRVVALIGSVIQAFLCIFLYFMYLNERARIGDAFMYFEQQFNWFPSLGISYHVGVDGISIAMMLLTSFVVIAGVLMSWRVEKMTREFFFLLILLSLGAYGFFLSLDLFLLFFFLEVAVIPKYLLIGIWGSGNRKYSANKLALMLMMGSALILVGILGLYFLSGKPGFDITQLKATDVPEKVQQVCFPLLFIGFGVFTALFPFHTWVPDGHSSAPTAGSMFLAGISMKLGGYGCLRVACFLLPLGAKAFAEPIIILSTIAIIYGAFATMMQKDLKYLNAYSSISHCGFVLLGLGMLTQTAYTGAVLQMVSHGLMTALFFAVIGMIYERTHTRNISEMGGLLKVMPMASVLLIIVGMCSLGLPGLSGFVAEMTIFTGAWQNNAILPRVATVLACMSIVVTAVYILRAVGTVVMGPLKEKYQSLRDMVWYEKGAAFVLLLGILIMGVAPGWLVALIKPATQLIMQKIQQP